MLTAAKPLLKLTAAQLMSREVIAIPEAMSLRVAAFLLSQAGIGGAPVVDRRGRCVGVLSATDIRRSARNGKPAADSAAGTPDGLCSRWLIHYVRDLPASAVRAHMGTDPILVSPGATVTELARHMLDAHIHRVVVVDRQRRPIGMVSGADLLAAVSGLRARRSQR